MVQHLFFDVEIYKEGLFRPIWRSTVVSQHSGLGTDSQVRPSFILLISHFERIPFSNK